MLSLVRFDLSPIGYFAEYDTIHIERYYPYDTYVFDTHNDTRVGNLRGFHFATECSEERCIILPKTSADFCTIVSFIENFDMGRKSSALFRRS